MDNLSSQATNVVIKVQDGTRSDGKHLCRTCGYRHCVELRNGRSVSLCNINGARFTQSVAACNRYVDRSQPTLREMEEIAWRLITKQAGRSMGFVSADQFRKMEQERWSGSPPASAPGF